MHMLYIGHCQAAEIKYLVSELQTRLRYRDELIVGNWQAALVI